MGNSGKEPIGAQRSARLLDRVPPPDLRVGLDEALLVCPWMAGLPPDDGLWLAALCIHDCNAYLEADWTFDAAQNLRDRCYFGVFALDRLRSTDSLFALLRARGIDRIINLPSVSFFDGAMAQGLGAFGFDARGEMRFLNEARQAGFRIGACRPATASPGQLSLDAELVVSADRPGQPLRVQTPS